MKVKKIPMRTCVVTKEKYPKWDLIRVVKNTDNEIVVDETGKVNGHGANLKKDAAVIEKARKNKCLNRILNVEIEDSIYEEILKKIN